MTHLLTRRRFTRRLGQALAVGGAIACVGRPARADEVSAEAELELSATTVRVGERLRIGMEVRAMGARAPAEIPWPDALLDHFEIANVSSGGGWSSSIVLGGPVSRISTRQTTATLTPLKAGTYEVSFRVDIGGSTFTSNVVSLEVLEAGVPLPEPPPGSEPTEAPGPVFLWAAVDKPEAYVGQQVTYALDVYERRSFLGIHLRKPPSFTDFFTEELPEGDPVVKRVGDVDFRVRPGLRRALFPQRAGTLEIGAAELSVGGRQRILSQVLTVEVKPLPSEGRPAGFSPNNVGRYTITAEVDRSTVAGNEPVTLQVTIAGEGNVKFVDPGTWPPIDGMRRYDPKVETRLRKGSVMGGERRYEFLLIPERGGSITIPAHELAFFDPTTERYEVARSEPIVLTIEGGEQAEPEPEPEPEAGGEEIAQLVGGDALPRHAPRERWLTPTRWLYGMLGVPALAAGGLLGATLWRRFGADEQLRARARRRQRRRSLMDAAEQAVEGGEGFHATLAKLLQEIAVERAGSEGVGLPRPELLRLLGQQDVPPGDVERLRDLLDRCDAARFGAQGGTPDDRRALLDEVLDLVRTSSLAKEVP
ncbi:MAG: protein BatD [Myxococcales bacterium]|nr:protein BatD [Myxococcales bacterium]